MTTDLKSKNLDIIATKLSQGITYDKEKDITG